jgi:hypothetical protein
MPIPPEKRKRKSKINQSKGGRVGKSMSPSLFDNISDADPSSR